MGTSCAHREPSSSLSARAVKTQAWGRRQGRFSDFAERYSAVKKPPEPSIRVLATLTVRLGLLLEGKTQTETDAV